MTTYLLNQPVAADDLSVSQPKLAANCNALDTVYGLDHVPFSNSGLTQGLHNLVTQPPYENPIGTTSANPPTTTTYPIGYCFQPLTGAGGTPNTNLGLLQYSRPTPNNATTNPSGSSVPTPITSIQSLAAAISINPLATINVFDFTGLTRAYAFLTVVDLETNSGVQDPTTIAIIVYDGTNVTPKILYVDTAGFTLPVSGKILQIKNNFGLTANQVFWTLQFLRTS